MNGLAQVRQLRMLSGPRPADDLIQDMHIGAQRLESLFGQWLIFPPRQSTITDAENTIEGLRRSLIELRAQQAGGADDAA